MIKKLGKLEKLTIDQKPQRKAIHPYDGNNDGSNLTVNEYRFLNQLG